MFDQKVHDGHRAAKERPADYRTCCFNTWFDPTRLNSSGFTLIELTVVIFIVGILFLTAMPRIGDFLYRRDLKDVARSLKASVHVLRSKSISTGKITALHFDLDKGIYWGNYLNQDRTSDALPRTEPLIGPKRLPDGVRFLDVMNINSPRRTSGILSSIFNTKGVFEETILHLTDRNNRILSIIINAYTGRFLLYDEYVDVEYGRD